MAGVIEDRLEQNSEIWHHWRNSHLGSSDASLIAAYFIPGIDWPYGTWAGADLWKLWAVKTARLIQSFKRSPAMQHGVDTEPAARAWYMEQTGEFTSPVCMTHAELRHLSASLDGWTGEKAVEIKCPTEPQDHRQAKEGKLPDKYYAQFQHILFVSGAAQLDYVSYYQGEGVIVPVRVDQGFLEVLRNAEDTFWKWVKDNVFPLPKGDFVIDDLNAANYQTWKMLIDDYFQVQAMIREAEERERRIKLDLMRMMPGAKVKGFGATVAVKVRNKVQMPAYEKPEGLELSVRRG